MAKNPLSAMMAQAVQPGQAPPGFAPGAPPGVLQTPTGKNLKPPVPAPPKVKGKLPGKGPPGKGFPPKKGG